MRRQDFESCPLYKILPFIWYKSNHKCSQASWLGAILWKLWKYSWNQSLIALGLMRFHILTVNPLFPRHWDPPIWTRYHVSSRVKERSPHAIFFRDEFVSIQRNWKRKRIQYGDGRFWADFVNMNIFWSSRSREEGLFHLFFESYFPSSGWIWV